MKSRNFQLVSTLTPFSDLFRHLFDVTPRWMTLISQCNLIHLARYPLLDPLLSSQNTVNDSCLQILPHRWSQPWRVWRHVLSVVWNQQLFKAIVMNTIPWTSEHCPRSLETLYRKLPNLSSFRSIHNYRISTMSTLNNVASVANEKQGSFKPSIAPDGPVTDKGVSVLSFCYLKLTIS